MIERPPKTVIVIYLWIALMEDTLIFVLGWIAPDIRFRLLYVSVPAGLEIALLRSSAGRWAAFGTRASHHSLALAEGPGLACRECWRTLLDLSYIVVVPSLTTLGWILLVPPPFLNFVGVVIILVWGPVNRIVCFF